MVNDYVRKLWGLPSNAEVEQVQKDIVKLQGAYMWEQSSYNPKRASEPFRNTFGDTKYMERTVATSKFVNDFDQSNPSLDDAAVLRGYQEVHKDFIEKHQEENNFRNWRIVRKKVTLNGTPVRPYGVGLDNGSQYANTGEDQMYVIYCDHNKFSVNTWMWAMFPSNMNMAHYYNKVGRELLAVERKAQLERKAAQDNADNAIRVMQAAVKAAQDAVAALEKVK